MAHKRNMERESPQENMQLNSNRLKIFLRFLSVFLADIYNADKTGLYLKMLSDRRCEEKKNKGMKTGNYERTG